MGNRKSFIVLGLNYGDEGKGLVTDYLSRELEKPLVIRFNGGHQAGHTVVLGDGSKFIFSHFGAGTLRQVPTLWSHFCTFSPAYFLYEYDTLPISPKIFVDRKCPVTTHYDVLFNRCEEDSRGEGRLGSCGVGFGATIKRHHQDHLFLFAEDLFDRDLLRKKLTEIRSYYCEKFKTRTQFHFEQFGHNIEDQQLFGYVEELSVLISNGILELVDERSVLTSPLWSSHIYEGAQGILLDKDFGNRPYVTQSNTTSKNALELITRYTKTPITETSVYYVTRSYLTRHGGGLFSTLPANYELRNLHTETNIKNRYQGEFRRGYLNMDLIKYAIRSDETFSEGARKNLFITCLDQLPTQDIYFNSQGKISHVQIADLHNKLPFKFDTIIYSSDPCSEAMVNFNGISPGK